MAVPWRRSVGPWLTAESVIAAVAAAGILAHASLRWGPGSGAFNPNVPLYVVLAGAARRSSPGSP